MKKLIVSCISLCLFFSVSAATMAQAAEKGGCGPFFGSCCLGPRIGLEMNEGVAIKWYEWLNPIGIGVIIGAVKDGSKNGASGFFASCCIGPRVGGEYDKRKIRTMEWVSLIPYVGIIPDIMMMLEAADGKTMTAIEKEENLTK